MRIIDGQRQREVRRADPLAEAPRDTPSEVRIREDNERFETGIARIKSIYDRDQEEALERDHETIKIIESMPGDDFSTKVMLTLFKIWAEDYDAHMIEHEKAIEYIIQKAMALQRLGQPIFRGTVLEMSSGTGTIPMLISNSVSARRARTLRYILNDITPEMHEKARQKLMELDEIRMPRELTFTDQDIRAMSFEPESLDLVILSQTLHLITDPRLMELEKRDLDPMDKNSHEQIKVEVLRDAFRLLKPGGHLLVIDEWPAILTRRDRMGTIGALFYRTFRRIKERDTFIDMMSRVHGARFVADVKARIDADHRMYGEIYTKDNDKVKRRGKVYPFTIRRQKARNKAADQIIERAKAFDKKFIESFSSSSNGWVEFRPLFSGETITLTEPEKFAKKYNTIVLNRFLHTMTPERREKLISDAVNALEVGGALVIIDEWDAPKVKNKTPQKFSTRELRNILRHNHGTEMMFEHSTRVHLKKGFDSGMFGYTYRKRTCLSPSGEYLKVG